ncbi:hypothetical protein M569_03638 [Genlisea aurea]|uniref:X8 domain-containing protein n=1 Tax=Genlisea aurea TaxID=192259 RepID=S8E5P8_9LAMI|nr:hypothetical protein M569_03638 [Genlisea aurea]
MARQNYRTRQTLQLLLLLVSHSEALYCVCNSGLGDAVLQKNIDYACGNGADCSPILQNGPCYIPNTVKDHCSYAVNSYYQRQGETGGSCNFSGTASISQTPPANSAPGCAYPSSPSTGTILSPPSGGTTTAGGGGGTTTSPGSLPGSVNQPGSSGPLGPSSFSSSNASDKRRAASKIDFFFMVNVSLLYCLAAVWLT